MSASCKELLGIDGGPIEFEWHILTGFTSLEILQKIQNDLRERNIDPEKFTDWITSMFNDIKWARKGNDGICISNSEKNPGKREEILAGAFLGPGEGKKWYGTLRCTPEGKWDDSKLPPIQYSRVSVVES